MNKLINNKGEVYFKTNGVVKSYNTETGYGFLTTIDEQDDIYVHATNVLAKDKILNIGDQVSFLYTNTDKGLKAVQVRVTE